MNDKKISHRILAVGLDSKPKNVVKIHFSSYRQNSEDIRFRNTSAFDKVGPNELDWYLEKIPHQYTVVKSGEQKHENFSSH